MAKGCGFANRLASDRKRIRFDGDQGKFLGAGIEFFLDIGHRERDMTTFDSPVLLCEVCGEVVLRDTTCGDCARAHHCRIKECPYENEFLDQHRDAGKYAVASRSGSGERKFASGGDSLNSETDRPGPK